MFKNRRMIQLNYDIGFGWCIINVKNNYNNYG